MTEKTLAVRAKRFGEEVISKAAPTPKAVKALHKRFVMNIYNKYCKIDHLFVLFAFSLQFNLIYI